MSMESVSLLPCTSLTISTSCQSRNFSKLHVRRRVRSVKSGIAMCATGVGEKDGVIIVDHGSRRSESNLMLNEFVSMFREKTGYPIVEPAYMELAEPSIKDAFGLCVQRGPNHVIVSPSFLLRDGIGIRYSIVIFLVIGSELYMQLLTLIQQCNTKDIPSLISEAAKEHSDVLYIITAPLGLHELLVDVMNDRIKHCLSHVAGAADECAACAGTGKCKLY